MNSTKNNFNLLCVLITCRAIPILFLISFYPKTELLRYTDFSNYNTCNLSSVNPGFSFITCILGIYDVTDYFPVFITILLTFSRDYIYILLSKRFLNQNQVLFYTILLALHPYLAAYSLKYSSSLFESLCVLYLFIFINYKKDDFNWFNSLIFIIIFLFRNPLFGTIVAILTLQLFTKIDGNKYKTNIILLSTLVIIFMFFYYFGVSYTKLFLDYNTIYSYNSVLMIFGNYNLFLQHLFTAIAILFSHYFMLTGFREAFFTEGMSYFDTVNPKLYFELFIGFFLILIHSIGFYGCYKKLLASNKLNISLIFVIFPSFLVVAHLRYLYSLIPILLLGMATLYFSNE